MPLVLAQNEHSAADVKYADELGLSYEFPTMYRNKVQPGESFVYYQGKRKTGSEIQVPRYFGAGTIGEVSQAPNGRLRCEIRNYRAFDDEVPFKRDGRYLETGANERPSRLVGGFFQQGVRKIDQKTFDEICSVGIRQKVKRAATIKAATQGTKRTNSRSEDPILDLAVRLATAEAKAEWPTAKVFRAPAGQYFSLIVRHPSGDSRHIAVKATEHEEPYVRLSREEVSYSDAHATSYSLWVVYALNLDMGTGRLIKRQGRITDDDIDIQSAMHGGRLQNLKSARQVGPIPE